MEELINFITNNPWLFAAGVLLISAISTLVATMFYFGKELSVLRSNMDDLKSIRLNAKAISETPQKIDELREMFYKFSAEIPGQIDTSVRQAFEKLLKEPTQR